MYLLSLVLAVVGEREPKLAAPHAVLEASAGSLIYLYIQYNLLLQRLPECENLSLQHHSRVIDLSIFVISVAAVAGV